jgi:hypothetical protein
MTRAIAAIHAMSKCINECSFGDPLFFTITVHNCSVCRVRLVAKLSKAAQYEPPWLGDNRRCMGIGNVMKKSSRTTLSMIEEEMAEPRVTQSARQGISALYQERRVQVVRADSPRRLSFSLARHLCDPRKAAATMPKQCI